MNSNRPAHWPPPFTDDPSDLQQQARDHQRIKAAEARANDPASNTALEVMQYNIHLCQDSVMGKVPGMTTTFQDSERLRVITDLVLQQKPALVGFSEAWAKGTKDYLINRLSAVYPHHAWDGVSDATFTGVVPGLTEIADWLKSNIIGKTQFVMGSGLILFSQHPIVSSKCIHFKDLVGEDQLSQKGFLLARISIGSQTITVCQAHLQADATVLTSPKACVEARASNIKQVLDEIATIPRDEPVLLLGDLNVIGEDAQQKPTAEYQSLREKMGQAGLGDAYRVVHGTSGPGYSYDAISNKLIGKFAPRDTTEKIQQRLDYMFSRGFHVREMSVPGNFIYASGQESLDLSDHYPLRGLFWLPK